MKNLKKILTILLIFSLWLFCWFIIFTEIKKDNQKIERNTNFDFENLYWFNLVEFKDRIDEVIFSNLENNNYIKINLKPEVELKIYPENEKAEIINKIKNIQEEEIGEGYILSDSVSFQHNSKHHKILENEKWEVVWISYFTFEGQYLPWDFVYFAFIIKNDNLLRIKFNLFWDWWGQAFNLWKTISQIPNNKYFLEEWNNIIFDYNKFYQDYLSKWYFDNVWNPYEDYEKYFEKSNEIIQWIINKTYEN